LSFIESPSLFLENSTPFVDCFWGGLPIAGIENIRMIQKGQIVGANYQVSTFKHFAMLMAA